MIEPSAPHVLTTIDIENFRCSRAAHLELDSQATGIVGENGSGKTSLLESIYFLAHGRSFRANQREKLLPPQAEFLRVVDVSRQLAASWLRASSTAGRAHARTLRVRASRASPRSPKSCRSR